MLAEGQRVLVAAKGLAEVQRLAGDGEIEVVLRERDVVFRTSRAEVTARLIEGDFPNYEQLIPSGYPNRLTVAQGRVDGRARPGADRGSEPRQRGGAALDGCRGAGARDVGAGRRQRAGVARREVRGHRAHGRVQPGVPARRGRRGRRRRGRARHDRPAEAGDACGPPAATTSCTCSCRCARPELACW